ncbi:MAG: ABC transporter ATP-binding protein/permease [Bdellovibrionaceae bacterium]|nr:ABC transporter ATP-binding protein/permease [Pseudobdellovibrionaceae bacterium]
MSSTNISLTKSSQKSNHFKTIKTLGFYLWPKGRMDLKIRVLLAVCFLICAKLINVYVPFLLKQAVDHLSVGQALLTLPLGVILAYGIASVTVQLFGEFRDLLFIKVEQHAQRIIALNTFKHLHALSLDFHLARQTGGLSRVIERGTRGIQFLLDFMTFNIIPTLFEIFLVTGVLLYRYDFRYSLITFSTIALYIFLTLVITEWRLKYRKQMLEEETNANIKAVDSLLNFETVKYFGNEKHEHHRFNKSLLGYENAAIKSQYSLSALNVTQASIIGAGLLSLMIFAGQDVVAGKITVGDFVLINAYLIQLYLPLGFLGFVYREIKNSLVDMEKMFEITEVHASVADKPDAQVLASDASTVEFQNVRFGYNSDREILKGIDFKVDSGKTLAIVGSSGAGKSTISRLLFRFYDVSAGHVRVSGTDIRDVTQESLRSHIGVVPQDTVLFNDSIGYNISYGRPSASHEEMVHAAKLANIHDFVMGLPQQYDTPVGERGLKLSGGEKQRVAIARTILKNPPILLFDEATSSLDTHNEREIQEALKKVSEKRTTLIIAHRLSTVVYADEIIVLQNGTIIERGRHFDLLSKNGTYAAMWRSQQEEKEVALV